MPYSAAKYASHRQYHEPVPVEAVELSRTLQKRAYARSSWFRNFEYSFAGES